MENKKLNEFLELCKTDKDFFEIKHYSPKKKLSGVLYKKLDKNGIEILGMKPNRTADGKYKYEGTSIKDLKEACKKNGIKGYSTCKDKCDLVKLLMKI